jgi:GH35 family endo-1,4-beta-xylanase
MDKARGKLNQKTLSEALSLPKDAYVIFKDYVTGLEYIRSCQELKDKGLFVELGGYQCHVFLDWQFVNGEQWQVVCESLNGAGVPSAYGKFDEMFAVKVEEKKVPEKRVKSKKVKSEKKTAKPLKNQVKPKSTPKKK